MLIHDPFKTATHNSTDFFFFNTQFLPVLLNTVMKKKKVNCHSWSVTDSEKGKGAEKMNLKCISRLISYLSENSAVSIINKMV